MTVSTTRVSISPKGVVSVQVTSDAQAKGKAKSPGKIVVKTKPGLKKEIILPKSKPRREKGKIKPKNVTKKHENKKKVAVKTATTKTVVLPKKKAAALVKKEVKKQTPRAVKRDGPYSYKGL